MEKVADTTVPFENNGKKASIQSNPNVPYQKKPLVHLLPQSNFLISSLTILRDQTTPRSDFLFHSDRVTRMLLSSALTHLPYVEHTITTPLSTPFHGQKPLGNIVGVSILRAGDSMTLPIRSICPSARLGSILIQRDETNAEAILMYTKLPTDIAQRTVLLLDPMLATGNSAIKAVQVLTSYGVPSNKIVFVNVVCCPKGIERLTDACPGIRIVTAAIDDGLNEKMYILPGLGDFGCRYFGTDK
jgi:uracil phosphoribosyltransferase